MLDCFSLEGRSASQLPPNHTPTHPPIHPSATHLFNFVKCHSRGIPQKQQKISKLIFFFIFFIYLFSWEVSARCTFYTFLKAQVTVEMEILKVTNPITHEENVLTVFKLKMGNKLIAGEGSTRATRV